MTVFIVIDSVFQILIDVFSTEERARDWIDNTSYPKQYGIESFVVDSSYGEKRN